MKNRLGALDIQLFADGGGAEGTGAADTGAAVSQPQSGETKVVYGKQPEKSAESAVPVAGEQNSATDNAETKVSFEELIKGDYKDEYSKNVQSIVGKRIAQEKARMQPINDVIDKLMVRYGAESIEDLSAKLDDDSVFEAMAAEKGENPDTLRQLEQLRVFQDQVNRQRKFDEAARNADAQYEKWMNEAEKIREIYPDFNLERELQNPRFGELISIKNLQHPISMLDAYKTIHLNEIVKAAEAEALSKAARSVNLNASRPSENGLGNQSGVVVKDDVSKLTKKDRADIARRAARGERIEF